MARKKRMLILSEEEKKIAMKYADLLPEYNQLEKEVQEIRNTLQKAKLKRDNLIGVVRFLRQKCRKLKKISAD
ncbi:hypothetical protein SUGI_0996220 [Cryptomeria japonica]|nr:hypothetical protein SUGI_0996220 [Cryptomeria japonica]